MLKNVTITLTEETALWARKKAAEQNTSVSRLVGEMLEQQMHRTDEYWRAFERWKAARLVPGIDAANRPSRTELHERR